MISLLKNTRLFLLALLCMALLFTQCRKNKKQELAPFAELHVQVKNQNNASFDTVTYYVFENEVAFRSSLAGSPTGYVLSGKITNGMIDIPTLPSGKDYYLLAQYYDTKTFPGYSILYTNEESTYFLAALNDEAVLNASVMLRPQEGLATFSTSNDNASLLPITIKTQSKTDSIQLTGETKIIKLRKGTFMAQASAKQRAFCNWQKSFQVTGGQNTAVTFEKCNYGQVVFFTQSTDDANDQIDVFIGINNQIGTLTRISPGLCAGTDGVRAFFSPGDYSYYAESKIRKCAWTGKFTISTSMADCVLIELKDCGKQ